MGLYKHLKETFQKEYKERDSALKGRIVVWRREPTVNRILKPTNLARARELGYKAKQGVIVARVRIPKGLTKRRKPAGGRKPSKSGRFYALVKSSQAVAEARAARKFRNCETLNSYYVGEDGQFSFYEAILIDRANPHIMADKDYSRVIGQRGRAFRGITSSGRKHRGIMKGTFGTNQNRPSKRSKSRKMFRQQ